MIHERLQYALRDPFTLRVLDALIGDLGEMGLGVLLLPSPSPDADDEPNLLATASMDAAVLMRVRDHDEPALEILARRELPFAIVEGTAPGAAAITIPDRRAIADLIRHLVELGSRAHRDRHASARDAPSDGSIYEGDAARRRHVDAHAQPPGRVRGRGHRAVRGGRVCGLHGRGGRRGRTPGAEPPVSSPRPWCASPTSWRAAWCWPRANWACGCHEDVSITGFDGLDLPWLQPLDLTTVPQDGAAKGHLIAQGVKALLAGEEPPVIELAARRFAWAPAPLAAGR